jgi:hypothetical protein
MRFRVLVEGEHAEGLEARERFQGLVDGFLGSLKANGFPGHSEVTLDAKTIFERVYPELATSAEVGEFTPLPPAEEVFAEPLSDAALRAAIRREKKATGGNKTLSQQELAERLGVTRYRIQKVLK